MKQGFVLIVMLFMLTLMMLVSMRVGKSSSLFVSYARQRLIHLQHELLLQSMYSYACDFCTENWPKITHEDTSQGISLYFPALSASDNRVYSAKIRITPKKNTADIHTTLHANNTQVAQYESSFQLSEFPSLEIAE